MKIRECVGVEMLHYVRSTEIVWLSPSCTKPVCCIRKTGDYKKIYLGATNRDFAIQVLQLPFIVQVSI